MLRNASWLGIMFTTREGPCWTPASGPVSTPIALHCNHRYNSHDCTGLYCFPLFLLHLWEAPNQDLFLCLLHFVTRDLGNTHPHGDLSLWALTLSKVNQQVVSPQAHSSFFIIFFIILSYVNILPRLRPVASQPWSHTSHLPYLSLTWTGQERRLQTV